ncbi:hypothetical protein GKE82_24215 [Conexibacter sp. W3-3-2]|nr:hypothetical protein [Conexibacter sp. W3-3-2]MTD47314.1 hypothetical protein [Conexibacter sp. W3-3-2]
MQGDDIDLGQGQNTVFGPDGPGRFRLTLRSYSGQWSVRLRVEEYS